MEDLDDDTDSIQADTENSDSETVLEGSHPTAEEFSAMTMEQIVKYASKLPLSAGECDDEGSQCVVSFIEEPICTVDGYLLTPGGNCDETRDGYFCTPNIHNCSRDSVLRCNEVAPKHFQLMISAAQCVVGDNGAQCALKEEHLLMDCNDLIGVRYCDPNHDGFWITEEVGCRVERDTEEGAYNNWRGCVPGASTHGGICDTDEWCVEDWVSHVVPNGELEEEGDYEGDAPHLWYTENAQCEFCENMRDGYCYQPLID
ncbi:MAG: hypothetical protein JXR76_23105 [Deltaproteobacteria bacterium]|nr:hypothetical protein [Deltaproteobacteria bacterium]